ncbi:hypothetical protein V6U90_08550 [Micromonospora sp. CPCC 206060]|uniref:hypothetical protein n=1 Tax=Micromonospora sp. CPCC 206060 TaxID=3122406 RepID=UPI002FEF5733
MSSRMKIMQSTAAALVTIGAHTGVNLAVADALWVGRDSPAEWVFYHASAACLLLPVTATLGWLLTRWSRARHIGRGILVGAALLHLIGTR